MSLSGNDSSPNTTQYFDFVTQHVEELREGSVRWNQDYRQLATGTFDGRILMYQFPDIQLVRISWSVTTQSMGQPPGNAVTLVIPVEYDGPARWHGKMLSPQDVVVAHSARGHNHNFISTGRLTAFTASVNLDLLRSLADSYMVKLSEQLLSGNTVLLQPDPEMLASLTDYLNNLFSMLQQKTYLASLPVMQTIIRRDFLPFFFDVCITSKESTVETTFPSERFALVQCIEEYALTYPNHPLTLHDLCTTFHLSKRKLQCVFQDCIGMSPMAYIKAQRLNRVRRHLKNCLNKTDRITDIAHNHGFWHLGHFSKDYKAMFGESPSDTLKNR